MTGPGGRWDRVMLPNYGTPSLMLVKGQGAHVWSDAGKRYLDLLAGLAVNILGHAHPAIVDAVSRQVATLGHTSNLYANEPGLRLAERLSAMTNGKRVALVNSGTEANELALKIVRRRSAERGVEDGVVLAFDGSFHGRTSGALALTGQPAYHAGFAPLPGGVVHVPYNDGPALEAAFEAHDVVGVFAEFIQGEGGVVPMDRAFASALTAQCAASGALLVADEVQTGLGRTGATFAYERYGARPDMVTLAKGLGGGLPLGACLVEPSVAHLMGPGSHGCTFGGNPIACAAGNAVLDVLERELLAKRAARLGQLAVDRIAAELGADAGSVRGHGLLMGIPLDVPKAPQVIEAMAKRGVLVGQAGADVVRLAPPLIVQEEALEDAMVPLAAEVSRTAGPPTPRSIR